MTKKELQEKCNELGIDFKENSSAKELKDLIAQKNNETNKDNNDGEDAPVVNIETESENNDEKTNTDNDELKTFLEEKWFFGGSHNVTTLCKELNEKKVQVVSFTKEGGLFRVLGIEAKENRLITHVQKANATLAIKEINELGGVILGHINLLGGNATFLVAYDEVEMNKRLLLRAQKLKQEMDLANKKENEAKAQALKSEKAKLEEEISKLES